MKPKLSDWASIAEIGSGIVVIVTLIVLIIGVRENTEVLRMSTYSELMRDINSLISDMYRDPELNRIWVALYDLDTESFSEADIDRTAAIVNSLW